MNHHTHSSLGGIPYLIIFIFSGMILFTGCKDSQLDQNTLNIYAASSLTEAFQDLKQKFELIYPKTKILLSFSGSQVLRLHIDQGADADIFASANPKHMKALILAGKIQKSQIFAHNKLVLIVPLNNPSKIKSLGDLAKASRIVIATKNVPVGSYTYKMLSHSELKLGKTFKKMVLSHIVSKENNVRLVRAKVELGEADAAIVYQTDAIASKRVLLIPIPSPINVLASYPIGIVKKSRKPTLAKQWINFVFSQKGRLILSKRGFVVK